MFCCLPDWVDLFFFSCFILVKVSIFTNPSARAGYDTRSIFKQSLTGLNSEFSFSWTSCLTKAEEPSLSYYLPVAGGRIIVFIPFPRVLVLCEMQLVSSRITILYRNTKVKVRSPDEDTEYFDIVAGVLQGDTPASYLFIICLDYVLRTSIDKIRENGFKLTKKRSRRYPAKTITDADYADDITLLANTPNQVETLLHSLERATAGIGFHVNAYKTEYMCYNQAGDISTLDGTSLKLVDKFTNHKPLCQMPRSRWDHVTLQYTVIAGLIQFTLHLAQILDSQLVKKKQYHDRASSVLFGWCDTGVCNSFHSPV